VAQPPADALWAHFVQSIARQQFFLNDVLWASHSASMICSVTGYNHRFAPIDL